MDIVVLLIGGSVLFLLWKIDNERSKNKGYKTGEDEYFDYLNQNPDLYQHFFEKIAEVSNDKLWAGFILNPKFAISDKAIGLIEEEEKKTEEIFKEAVKKGLSNVTLLVLYLQYATADPLFDQDTKKSYWVSTVLDRKSTDSFPHHNAIVHYLKQIGYIEE